MARAAQLEVRHRNAATSIRRKSPERLVIDLTSRAEEPWVRFSPFFPHGGIPVPFSEQVTAASVEGIWQGLKVFEGADVDVDCLANETMRGLKRTVRKFGPVLGHRKGVKGTELLDYANARRLIYLPSYTWVLENRLASELAKLCELVGKQPVSLLDYETNCDVDNLAKPLSHAGLVAAVVRDRLGLKTDLA